METATPLHSLDSRSLDEPGDHPVDGPMVCVITRFGLRGIWQLWATYWDYRRVVRQAHATHTPGLLRSAFLIENLRTCYTLSIWADPGDIPHFGANVPEHVMAGNRCFGRLAFHPGRGPELWSTKWRLASVSNNLNWEDFDLRALIRSVMPA